MTATVETIPLIVASILMACAVKPALDTRVRDSLEKFGRNTGLAFQVKDDLLDIEGSTGQLGKQQGADEALDKATYPRLLGIDGARLRARQLYDESVACLAPLGENAEPLQTLLNLIVHRNH